MTTKRLLLSFGCFALCATSVLAQRPSSRTPPTPEQMVARQVAHITSLLALTTAQQAQATTIFTAEQRAAESLHTSMETVHDALEAAVKANNTAGINSAANQLGNLTTQQVVAQATAKAALYAILTAEQKTKLEANGVDLGPGGGRGPGGRGGAMHGGPSGFGRGQ